MNILILNWRDINHPLAGGAEKMLLEHANYWLGQGASITWVTSVYEGAKSKEKIDGINYIRFGSHYTIHPLFFLRYIKGDFRNYTVVIDCFHFLPFLTPLYMKKVSVIALIHEIAGKIWFNNVSFPIAVLGFFIEPLLFVFYRNVPFITVSKSTQKELIHVGIPPKNIHIIPNGINKIKSSAQKEKKATILFLGMLSKDKGIKDALEAFKKIVLEMPNIQLWIVGKEIILDSYKNLLKQVFKNNPIYLRKIKYFGYVNERKKIEILKKSWLLIFPPTKEGWGLTVIEAASQATPTVGYRVPGLTDSIKQKKTGILSDTNPTALAHSVMYVLNNPQLLKKMSQNAKEWSQQFSWRKSGKVSWNLLVSTTRRASR